MRWRIATFILLLAVLVVVIGCGSSNPAATNQPPTTPPSPTPPSPGPLPPPNPATTQWSSNVTGASGSVTVSTAGDVTIQVTKAMPNTTYVGDFCQYPGSDYSTRGLNPCFGLQQSLTTDAGGNGQLSFHFPRSGAWAGEFFFAPGGDTNSPSRITTDNTGPIGTLSAPLVAMSKANSGGAPGAQPATQEPGSGTVMLNGGSVTVTLKGGTASATLLLIESFSDGGSASQQIGTLNTDASGNATGTFTALSSSGAIFAISRNVVAQTANLATGFTVP